MTPNDRVDGICWLVVAVATSTIAIVVAEMILAVVRQVPVVTKDPHTGQLFIPRSNLIVGQRSRRHHGIAQPRARSQPQR
jgi:hypothetical protein